MDKNAVEGFNIQSLTERIFEMKCDFESYFSVEVR